MSSIQLLSAEALRRALNLRDLTDPARGPHGLQLLVRQATEVLSDAWGAELRVRRELPLVSVEDNYDALSYPKDAIARDARYTRYVSERVVLRTHTTAMLPGAAARARGRARRRRAFGLPGHRLPPRLHRPAAHRRTAPARSLAHSTPCAARSRRPARHDRAPGRSAATGCSPASQTGRASLHAARARDRGRGRRRDTSKLASVDWPIPSSSRVRDCPSPSTAVWRWASGSIVF